jgi:hypothetical protein
MQLGFRAEEHLRAFVDARSVASNMGLSDVVREATELYRDLYESLGPTLWYECVGQAHENGKTVGTLIAELIRAGLQARRRESRNNNRS